MLSIGHEIVREAGKIGKTLLLGDPIGESSTDFGIEREISNFSEMEQAAAGGFKTITSAAGAMATKQISKSISGGFGKYAGRIGLIGNTVTNITQMVKERHIQDEIDKLQEAEQQLVLSLNRGASRFNSHF